MKTYIVNCDKMKLFKTFKSMTEVMSYLNEINKSHFDGDRFSIFGDSGCPDTKYTVDSAVLCPKERPREYFTFFIRCLDSSGSIAELD